MAQSCSQCIDRRAGSQMHTAEDADIQHQVEGGRGIEPHAVAPVHELVRGKL